jgi:hypothetical protein
MTRVIVQLLRTVMDVAAMAMIIATMTDIALAIMVAAYLQTAGAQM